MVKNTTSQNIVADSYSYNTNTLIGGYLSGLNKRDRVRVMKAITDRTIPSPVMAASLCASGCAVAPRTVRDFRCALGV